MNFAKITAAAFLLASAAFAETGFHMGARVAGNYNMVWNVDNKISSTDIVQSLGFNVSDEDMGGEIYIKDLDQLSGMGVSFGLSFLYQANEMFGIQPELLFSYRSRSVKPSMGLSVDGLGTGINYSFDDAEDEEFYDRSYGGGYDNELLSDFAFLMNGEVEIDQWYLEIPVLFRLQPTAGLFFNLGPDIAINLSTEASYSIFSYPDASDYVSTVVFGVIAGLGYSFDLGNGQKVDVDFRFQMGLSSIVSDDIDIPDSEVSFDGTAIVDPKDMILTLGVSYWFL